MMRPSSLCLAVHIIVLIEGCGGGPPTTLPDKDCNMDPDPIFLSGESSGGIESLGRVEILEGCQSTSCGGNSPVINQFPVNGLAARGCRNRQRMALIPNSFVPRRGACGGSRLTLSYEMERGRPVLVARRGQQEVCREAELIGGTFTIRQWNKKDTKAWDRTIEIERIGMIPVDREGNKESIPAYVFSGGDAAGTSLCRREAATAWVERRRPEPARATPEPDLADYAMILPGNIYNIYDERGEVIPTNPDAEWFNIACAADSMAKVEAYQSLATPIGTQPEMRPAAFHMLTASYCKMGRHYTRRHLEIYWLPYKPELLGKHLEAVWGPDGAVCVSSSRMWSKDVLVPSDRIPKTKIKDKRGKCSNMQCNEALYLAEIYDECVSAQRDKLPDPEDPNNPTWPKCSAENIKKYLEKHKLPQGTERTFWASFIKNPIKDEPKFINSSVGAPPDPSKENP